MPRRRDCLVRSEFPSAGLLQRLFVAALALVLVGFASGCSGSKPAPAATAKVAPTAVAVATPRIDSSGHALPPPPADARPFPPALKADGDNILAQVARLRGMPAKGPVQMNLVGRKAAIDYYRAGYDLETKQRSDLQQQVYQLLGLIPPGTDISETFLKLLSTGILGFYDPDTKAFYLLDDLGGLDSPTSRTTVVHELTHALQDQYYDINKIEEDRIAANDWDGVTAFLDTIEGDAVSTEGAYRGTSARRAPCFQIPPVISLPSIPFVIYRGLNTWYEDGYCFVDSVAPDVSKRMPVLSNIPTTTEQVLHPDKYKAGETAKPVELVPLEATLGAGWSETARANLGEFVLQDLLVLGERNNRTKAAKGADGWGGDGWALYAKGDARLIEVSTVWDSAPEAREFYDTLLESLSNRGGGANQPVVGDAVFGLKLDASSWRVGISDDRVVMLVSSDADALAVVAAQLGM